MQRSGVVEAGGGGIGVGGGGELIAVGQAGDVDLRLAQVGRHAAQLHPPRAQRVLQMEVQGRSAARHVVSPDELAARINIGALPGVDAIYNANHAEFLAAGAKHVVLCDGKAIGRGVARGRRGQHAVTESIERAHPGKRPLGHADAVGVVEVAGHGCTAGDRRRGHGADLPLGVVEVLIDAVSEQVAGCVVERLRRYPARVRAGFIPSASA